MDLLRCHIELLPQLVHLLVRDHVETYMYSNYKRYGHINKTNGPTLKLFGPTCKLTHDLLTNIMDILAKPMKLLIDLMDILGLIVIKLVTQ